METYYTVQFCTAKSSTCTAYCFHPLNGSKWCVVNDAVCAHYISTLQCVAFDFMTGTLGMKHSTEDFCVLRNLEANTVILNQKMRSKPKLLAWEIQPGEMREGGLDWQERNRSQIATKAVQKQCKSSTKAVQKLQNTTFVQKLSRSCCLFQMLSQRADDISCPKPGRVISQKHRDLRNKNG